MCPVLAGQLRLFVSNNDHTVKVFALPSMRLMSSITSPVAINYAALSSDGEHLACVGDSEETHLYRAAPSGARPPIILTTKPPFLWGGLCVFSYLGTALVECVFVERRIPGLCVGVSTPGNARPVQVT
jgi:hypothetical protein